MAIQGVRRPPPRWPGVANEPPAIEGVAIEIPSKKNKKIVSKVLYYENPLFCARG